MMQYEDLWRFEENDNNSKIKLTTNIKEIMKQQCQYLKQNTNGKVLAKFAKIKVVGIGSLTNEAVVSAISNMSALSTHEVVGDSDTDGLKDGNELYEQKRYGFEIYNKTYKFRVFEMKVEPLYPAILTVDEGIAEDIESAFVQLIGNKNKKNQYSISSDDEFQSLLKKIFNSKKMQYIISKMMEND